MPPPTMSIPNPYLDLKTGIFKIFHLAIFQTYWGRLVGVRVCLETQYVLGKAALILINKN